jgi:excisionase family DNA binding protein
MADRTATSEELTVGEARALLRVSRAKMAELLKNGRLTWRSDPLDGRIRLVPRHEVEALLAHDKRRRRPQVEE